jgi:hypothetical protein
VSFGNVLKGVGVIAIILLLHNFYPGGVGSLVDDIIAIFQ